MTTPRRVWLGWAVSVLTGLCAVACAASQRSSEAEAPAPARATGPWSGIWATATQHVEPAKVPPELAAGDVTLRQMLRVTRAGSRLRVKFSNEFSSGPLRVAQARLARAERAGTPAVDLSSSRALLFSGKSGFELAAGATIASDPLEFPIEAQADLALSLHITAIPGEVTGHPGSRTTSFIISGDAVDRATFENPARVDQWFIMAGIDAIAEPDASAVVVLGDSLTDGRGSTTNGNDRWPDRLAQRLQTDPRTRSIAVLNMGIGGNRVLREGLGPAALARLERDVLDQPGVRWLIVFEGINDLGTSAAARARGEPGTSVQELIAAYESIATAARQRGLKVYAATLLPAGGSFYDVGPFESDRAAINAWIRGSGAFDAVIDFEAAVRDPADPHRLAAAYDSGDKLHLNPAGYEALAAAVPLALFAN